MLLRRKHLLITHPLTNYKDLTCNESAFNDCYQYSDSSPWAVIPIPTPNARLTVDKAGALSRPVVVPIVGQCLVPMTIIQVASQRQWCSCVLRAHAITMPIETPISCTNTVPLETSISP